MPLQEGGYVYVRLGCDEVGGRWMAIFWVGFFWRAVPALVLAQSSRACLGGQEQAAPGCVARQRALWRCGASFYRTQWLDPEQYWSGAASTQRYVPLPNTSLRRRRAARHGCAVPAATLPYYAARKPRFGRSQRSAIFGVAETATELAGNSGVPREGRRKVTHLGSPESRAPVRLSWLSWPSHAHTGRSWGWAPEMLNPHDPSTIRGASALVESMPSFPGGDLAQATF